MTLDSPLGEIKGVGEVLGSKLAAVGITTTNDLLNYFPRKYDDYSQIQAISELRPGNVTIKARVKQAKGRYVRRGLHVTEAVASDNTGSVKVVWFNQPYREKAIKKGADYFISGLFELRNQRLAITNPSMELASEFPLSTARIVPVYREAKGVKSAEIRRVLRELIPLIKTTAESLPGWIIKDHGLLPLSEAMMAIHFPSQANVLKEAKRRLGFEEVFGLSLASLLNKYETKSEHSLEIPFNEKLARQFVASLPFKLTNAQRRAVWSVYLDMQKPHPTNRLVEGDVGSGKTVVATMAALMAMEQGFQVALMAPTELLARQHAQTIHQLLESLGFAGQVGLLVGGLTPVQKQLAHMRIKDGSLRLIIGTHALIQEKVDMHKLGLVIIDEQHRFGVDQRKQLQAKAGHMPHVLTMTATPIPRSLALTLYGELDISVIDTKPEGRKPIITKIISPNSLKQLYEKANLELDDGRQMFVVCPLIADSELRKDSLSTETVYKEMQRVFKGKKIGVLHGKMKADIKADIMENFASGKLDVLVATTVVEVGVNVPNATVMLVEDAERFGLAQIHQLRGRVGRSEHQGYCYLIKSDSKPPSRRLRALESSSDGFALAELDLEIRGPGAIYGTMQHGALDLKVASLTDSRLIAASRQAAQSFIDKGENLLKYKKLSNRVKQLRAVTNLN